MTDFLVFSKLQLNNELKDCCAVSPDRKGSIFVLCWGVYDTSQTWTVFLLYFSVLLFRYLKKQYLRNGKMPLIQRLKWCSERCCV